MKTRDKLLQATFEEVYQHGYHGARLQQILKRAGNVNKGSMYHFFKSKKDMTLAVIDEIITPNLINKFAPLALTEKDVMNTFFDSLQECGFDFNKGCPMNNLIQELSPIDEDFKQALEKTYTKYEFLLEEIVKQAMIKDGLNIENSKNFAAFILICIEGGLGASKKSQDRVYYDNAMKELRKITQNF